MPRHVAIIMDGNGRWAQAQGKERTFGHQEGAERVHDIMTAAVKLGIDYLTLYTFSTENWNRPADEISALMGLVLTSLEDEIFMKNNVRFRVIGDIARLPQMVQNKLQEVMDNTAGNTAMTMVVALSYSARWEITHAVKQIAAEALQQKGSADDAAIIDAISEETVGQHLATAFMPDPDLLIRTGGELRISNYLLWQIAYSELYFSDVYWPDFSEDDLHRAIQSYQQRQRRYGKTEEQVENEK